MAFSTLLLVEDKFPLTSYANMTPSNFSTCIRIGCVLIRLLAVVANAFESNGEGIEWACIIATGRLIFRHTKPKSAQPAWHFLESVLTIENGA